MTNLPSFRMQEAILLHQSGAVAEAAARYADVLRREPRNIDALCLLGMALIEQGQGAEAAKRLRRAVRQFPDHAPAHNALGLAQRQLGQTDDALASFDRAIAKQPGYLEAYFNRAALLTALGRMEDVVETYDRALAVQPDNAVAWIARGLALEAGGDSAAAVASFERALALEPDAFEAQANRANALARLGRHNDAVEAYDRALALSPLPELHVNRGNSLRKLGRPDEALASYDRALADAPDMAAAHFSRGMALMALERYDDALAAFDRALALGLFQDDPVSRAHLHLDRATALDLLGRPPDEALAEIEHCLRLAPDDDEIQYLVSLVELRHGRWREAWPRYERRLALGIGLPPDFSAPPFPAWRGEAPDGGLLLIRCVQDRSDCIQFAGFAAHLARQGHRVALWSDAGLAPLLRTVPGVETVIADLRELPPATPVRWAQMISLPGILGTTPDTVPQTVPYLAAEPQRLRHWREQLGDKGFKIGIAWQGGPRQDRGRSIPLAAFAPLAGIPDVRLISLQKGFGTEQISRVAFSDRVEMLGTDFEAGPAALLDSAAVMTHLDLVVSVDSPIVHLAGALGRPAVLPLAPVGDWRWLLQRDHSPFYPSLGIVRQTRAGDWTEVMTLIADVARDLARRVAGDRR